MPLAQLRTPSAPQPSGPYSQGIQAHGFVFLAGQGGFDTTGRLTEGIGEQTATAIRNLEAVLSAAGASRADIVKVSVFLADLTDFESMNRTYESLFTAPYPARTTVQAVLPQGMRIEIDAIAAIGAAVAPPLGTS